MSKFFFTLLCGICIGTAAFSQTKGTTQFGINLGLNASTVTSGTISADTRVGLNAGVTAEHYFSERWSFKTKLLYDQKGWDNGYIFVNNDYKSTNYQLDFLTIPVLANWHFGRTKNWYLNFGPYVSFLMTAKETTTGMDVKDAFGTTDAGLDLGIGVKFPISGRSKFFIEYNGEGGAANINKDGTGATVRSSMSAINIGINF